MGPYLFFNLIDDRNLTLYRSKDYFDFKLWIKAYFNFSLFLISRIIILLSSIFILSINKGNDLIILLLTQSLFFISYSFIELGYKRNHNYKPVLYINIVDFSIMICSVVLYCSFLYKYLTYQKKIDPYCQKFLQIYVIVEYIVLLAWYLFVTIYSRINSKSSNNQEVEPLIANNQIEKCLFSKWIDNNKIFNREVEPLNIDNQSEKSTFDKWVDNIRNSKFFTLVNKDQGTEESIFGSWMNNIKEYIISRLSSNKDVELQIMG